MKQHPVGKSVFSSLAGKSERAEWADIKATLRRNLTYALPLAVALFAAFAWPPERAPSTLAPFLAPFNQLEWNGYDVMFHWRGPVPNEVDNRIRIVGFERSMAQTLVDGENHPWPPPRAFHARVVDNLVKDGAKAIVFDVLMSDPSSHGVQDDKTFDTALARAKRVVLACRITPSSQSDSREMVAPYYSDKDGIDFERSAKIAFADVPPPSDGVLRCLLPLQRMQGERLPSLSLGAYFALTGHNVKEARLTPDVVDIGDEQVPRTGPTAVDPTDPENVLASAYMDFPAGSNTFPITGYDQVYRGEFKPGTFRDKVVFIGVTGVELTRAQNDFFTTSYSRFSPDAVGGQVSRTVDGVVVQAQMLNALLSHGYVRHATRWEIFVAVALFGFAATWGIRTFMTWRGPLLLILSLTSYIAFAFGWFLLDRVYLPWVLPSGLLLLATAGVAYFERGEMRRKWAAYVSPAYMEVMLREGVGAKPRRSHATVIFGDIRGFTSFSERHEPEKVVFFLNEHLERMVKIVFEEGGTVDKFLGDGILVVFGAPRPQPDAARRAVRAAYRMQQAALTQITALDGEAQTFRTGLGIATGPLVAGHVGPRKLKTFTLIGDTVNLASRLQGITGQDDVIIDEATYEQVRPFVEAHPIGMQKVKGRSDVMCYVVTGLRDGPRPAS